MKIILAGGTGFLGKVILQELKDKLKASEKDDNDN